MQLQHSTDELACTLMEQELKTRRELVRTTLKPYIDSVDAKALSVTIHFSKEIDLSAIEEFVALERQCCAFLTFRLVQNSNGIWLQISGREGSEQVIRMFANGAT